MAAGVFRATAGFCRSMIIASTGGAIAILSMFVLGGFVLPRGKFLIDFFSGVYYLLSQGSIVKWKRI